ncbi:MAG: hypothetical protein ACREEM_32865 [Blastocatellia bacterium]
MQFGGSLRHISTFHYRDDKIGPLSTPVADIGAAGGVTIPAAQRLPTCSAVVTQNCLQAADVARYNQFYASLLGLVNNVSYMAVRDVDLKPLPVGTGLINDVVLRHWEFYASDVWRVKPSLTLAYGLQYRWHTPPVDTLGRQTVLIYKDSRKLIDPLDYLRQKKAAAEAGDIFNPDIAYTTLKDAGRDGGFDINRGSFAPRLSAAWQPSFERGLLGRVFGGRKTVMRGGYSLVYDRLNTVQSVVLPMLGVGFTQTLSVAPTVNIPTLGAQPLRAGIDGPIPVPANFAVSPPIAPAKGVGITTAFGELLSLSVDPKIGDPRNHTIDFTIQRELPGNFLVEVGYVGRFGRNLFQSVNLNSAPYFFKDKRSGQTFAQAFDAVAAQLRNGVARSDHSPALVRESACGDAVCRRRRDNVSGVGGRRRLHQRRPGHFMDCCAGRHRARAVQQSAGARTACADEPRAGKLPRRVHHRAQAALSRSDLSSLKGKCGEAKDSNNFELALFLPVFPASAEAVGGREICSSFSGNCLSSARLWPHLLRRYQAG